MMTRYFSVITPQQAPCPSAARQAFRSGAHTACTTAQLKSCGTTQSSSAPSTTVPVAVFQSANRLLRSHASHPLGVSGGGARRDGLVCAGAHGGRAQRSLMATRALYQFIAPEVSSEMVRYTAIRMAMHSTARPVWFMAVLAIETMSG